MNPTASKYKKMGWRPNLPLHKMEHSVLCKRWMCVFFTISFFCFQHVSIAQRVGIKGSITDAFTKEKISFASVHWKIAKYGVMSDSAGNFRIMADGFTKDTLVISYVGLESHMVAINTAKDTGFLKVMMETSNNEIVIVKSKNTRGYYWWKNLVKHKPTNDPFKYNSYAYELYNKLEIDMQNIKREKFQKSKILRPFAFILDNVDSVSEAKPFLPIFFTESISDCFYSISPNKKREVIKSLQTNGIKNESIMQYVGGINQRINAYQNYTVMFGKEFISPLSNVGNQYYNYNAADTEYIGGERYLHLFFSPKRDGENTFNGECWIYQKTWALKKITLNSSPTANINFVNRITIIQEFAQKNDSVWVFAKDKFITDISLAKKEKLAFIARKTSIYNNVKINEPFIADILKTNKMSEQVVVTDTATNNTRDEWLALRPEALTKNEMQVFKMIDTLKSMPTFKKYMNIFMFVVDGRKSLGKVEIGPWYKWFSKNQLEKTRLRFDLATTDSFSHRIRLHTYLAYGFGDTALKGRFDVTYKFPQKTGLSVYASYTHDVDNGRINTHGDDNTTDNMFSQLIRRDGIKQKFLMETEIKTWVKKEWNNNISAQLQFSHIRYDTYTPFAKATEFTLDGRNIENAEFGLKLRFAPNEKTIRTKRRDFKIGGENPAFNLGLFAAVPNILGSGYRYRKVTVSMEQNLRLPRWGRLKYELYAGKYYSTNNLGLPFMVLEVHPGNEIYYYNKTSFNLMNRFEYISDQYAGVNIEHDFDKKLLNLLPFMRKSNMRQFWTFKSVVGNLSINDKRINIRQFPDYVRQSMYALNGNAYTELGTGFENIFKFLRIDGIWRFAPQQIVPPTALGAIPNPNQVPNKVHHFGLFFSFHFQL